MVTLVMSVVPAFGMTPEQKIAAAKEMVAKSLDEAMQQHNVVFPVYEKLNRTTRSDVIVQYAYSATQQQHQVAQQVLREFKPLLSVGSEFLPTLAQQALLKSRVARIEQQALVASREFEVYKQRLEGLGCVSQVAKEQFEIGVLFKSLTSKTERVQALLNRAGGAIKEYSIVKDTRSLAQTSHKAMNEEGQAFYKQYQELSVFCGVNNVSQGMGLMLPHFSQVISERAASVMQQANKTRAACQKFEDALTAVEKAINNALSEISSVHQKVAQVRQVEQVLVDRYNKVSEKFDMLKRRYEALPKEVTEQYAIIGCVKKHADDVDKEHTEFLKAVCSLTLLIEPEHSFESRLSLTDSNSLSFSKEVLARVSAVAAQAGVVHRACETLENALTKLEQIMQPQSSKLQAMRNACLGLTAGVVPALVLHLVRNDNFQVSERAGSYCQKGLYATLAGAAMSGVAHVVNSCVFNKKPEPSIQESSRLARAYNFVKNHAGKLGIMAGLGIGYKLLGLK